MNAYFHVPEEKAKFQLRMEQIRKACQTMRESCKEQMQTASAQIQSMKVMQYRLEKFKRVRKRMGYDVD